MAGFLAQLVLTAMLATAAPLTPAQQMQLESARDTLTQTDEGALYPLLENALLWPANLEAGASIPDYTAIAANPATHRGQLFLIEGVLRRAQPIGKLALPGPWEPALSEWTIQYGDKPEHMLVVNLVAPPGQPVDGTQVRLAARFYKLWVTTTASGQPRSYMVFVGRDARIMGSPRPFGLGGQVPTSMLVLVMCLGVFALVWVIRRTPKMTLNPRPTSWQQRRRESQALVEQSPSARREAQERLEEELPGDPTLPRDPAAALKQLEAGTAEQSQSTNDNRE